jgi:hypothetical protein
MGGGGKRLKPVAAPKAREAARPKEAVRPGGARSTGAYISRRALEVCCESRRAAESQHLQELSIRTRRVANADLRGCRRFDESERTERPAKMQDGP